MKQPTYIVVREPIEGTIQTARLCDYQQIATHFATDILSNDPPTVDEISEFVARQWGISDSIVLRAHLANVMYHMEYCCVPSGVNVTETAVMHLALRCAIDVIGKLVNVDKNPANILLDVELLATQIVEIWRGFQCIEQLQTKNQERKETSNV